MHDTLKLPHGASPDTGDFESEGYHNNHHQADSGDIGKMVVGAWLLDGQDSTSVTTLGPCGWCRQLHDAPASPVGPVAPISQTGQGPASPEDL